MTDITCAHCGSPSHHKKGKDILKNGLIKYRFRCKDCGKHFYSIDIHNITFTPLKKTKPVNTWVITTALNNSNTNTPFFQSLVTYCEYNNADLMIVPVEYNPAKLQNDKITWDSNLEPYFFKSNVYLLNGLRLMAGTAISPTTVNPLSGWDAATKGNSLIILSPQIMMRTVAKDNFAYPSIIHTSGCVSEPTYLSTKSGEKAIFNHSYSALVIEEDPEIDYFHIRVLNSDSNGSFYDIDKFYDGKSVTPSNRIPAIVLGDEHVKFIDPVVKATTFENHDSIVNTLNPEKIIRHDVLDFYSASHHHANDTFLQYKKFLAGDNDVQQELKETIEYLINTTPKNSTSYLVDSNHNNHLTKWLNTTDIKKDFTNIIIYHELSLMKYIAIRDNIDKDAFELWANQYYNLSNIKFLKKDESYKIFDIDVSMHGDNGTNGSRGSVAQFAKLGQKSIVGHYHSPSIHECSYAVGHSCLHKMEYNKGPSSWHQAHCIIQPNGKRQMIFINKGKWRR